MYIAFLDYSNIILFYYSIAITPAEYLFDLKLKALAT